METKFISKNLQQHIFNSLYSDRCHGDTILRAQGVTYLCHAAILASSSSLLTQVLNDPKVKCLCPYLYMIIAKDILTIDYFRLIILLKM